MAAESDQYEALFLALAHPARRRILISLNFAGGSLTAGEIAGLFGHAWPTTTRHLQVLEHGELVSQRRVGRTRVYELERATAKLGADWLAWFGRDPVTAEEQTNDEFSEPVPVEHRGRRSRTGH